MKALAWRLGWRAFFAPGSKLLLSSSFAMALGLVPLVLVLSIADGMIDGISSRTIETALYHAQLWPMSETPDEAAVRKSLAAVPGFRGVWPEQRGFALAYGSSGVRLGLSVRGIDESWARDSGTSQFLRVDAGALELGANHVWLGREAAEKLGVRPGDELKLLTTRAVGKLLVPRVTAVTVAAVVSVGYQELDRLWLFLPLSLSKELLDPADSQVFWGVKGDLPLDQTSGFVAGLRQAAGADWQVISWQAAGRSQFLNYQATKTLLSIVMLLVLVVAVVNVSTAMVTAVAERRRETAILKALGATDGVVLHQFLLLGFVAGVFGTLVGLGGGVVAALLVNPAIAAIDAVMNVFSGGGFHLIDRAYYLETLPVKFDPAVLALAGGASVLLATLASWLPARRAAKERPLDVLRRV